MLIRKPLFKKITAFALPFLLWGISDVFSQSGVSSHHKKSESALYRDVFDQNIYYEGIQYFHLERLYRDLFGKKKRALNVNVFDEVPDSTFFTNRHGRKRMSLAELKQGPAVTQGPDPSGPWTITKGKFDGVSFGFFIKDGRGDKYLLKFDPIDSLELSTTAEVAGSRFYHAIGYNVPQYTLIRFQKDQLTIDPGARVYDETGFQRPLTPERLEEMLLFVPQNDDGRYVASASLILKGEILGPWKFQGRRKTDPDDLINHEDRREIRALQVFSYWLNNIDTRASNTIDVIEEIDGRPQIRHYLIDFNACFGAIARGPKPPQVGHEHLIDYGETLKAFLTLGLWKKPWQKRWDEANRKIHSPSVGYFDNRYSRPDHFKTQLPYYPFKDLTRADGFWAAKIVMRFTDEEIREIVSAGGYSDPVAQAYISQMLIERRDLVGRYWFKQANPLDEFRVLKESRGDYKLQFEDLAVKYGFDPEQGHIYHVKIIGKRGKKGTVLAQDETQEKAFRIPAAWFDQFPFLHILIRVQRTNEEKLSPWVRVEIESEGAGRVRLAGILHQD